ncbi:MAG: hypothetical protein FWF59_13415 [Turicibacter sp.]|nr:hypothetical protein [Turicibacter sp.]
MKKVFKVLLAPLLVALLSVADYFNPYSKDVLVLLYVAYPLIFVAQALYLKSCKGFLSSTVLALLAVDVEFVARHGLGGFLTVWAGQVVYAALAVAFFHARKLKTAIGLALGIVLGLFSYSLVATLIARVSDTSWVINTGGLAAFLVAAAFGSYMEYRARKEAKQVESDNIPT